jgi:hypothetical protein
LKYFILIIITFTGLLLIGCERNHNTPTNTADLVTSATISSSPTSASDATGTLEPGTGITADTGFTIANDSIYIHGRSTLADYSILRTQLYEDGKPLDWWPAGQDVSVHGGSWLIYIPLGKNGAPNILAKGIYTFEAWERDNPSNLVGFAYIDLTGQIPGGP